MIALFTDYGLADPYVGQLKAVLARDAPGVAVIDLFHGVPRFDIRAGAYLLPAYTLGFPAETVFVCVVDPGVGGARRPVIFRADDRWYVGPDNGLFHVLERRAARHECHLIRWRPPQLSASFHGRDLFAPVAAQLARAQMPDAEPAALSRPAGELWPDDLAEILYVDHYGNAISGLRAGAVRPAQRLRVGGEVVKYARAFSEAAVGMPFWYENANGLVEIAVNRGSAALALGLKLGDSITLV